MGDDIDLTHYMNKTAELSAKVNQLKVELDATKDKNKAYILWQKSLKARDELQLKNERLMNYVRHSSDCDWQGCEVTISGPIVDIEECTCGLEALLADTQEQLTKNR